MRSVLRFERWIIIPLQIAFMLLALRYFIGSDLIGGTIAIGSVLVNALIGRSMRRGRADALDGGGSHPVTEHYGDSHGLTQASSLLLTKGLAYSTGALTLSVMALAMHSGTYQWWVVVLSGIGVAALFPFLCKVVVQLVPMLFAGRGGSGSSLLPESITCPHCSAVMSLDEEERWIKCFVCPQCDSQIDLR